MISDKACDCNGEMCHENQVCLKKDDSSFSCEYPCEHPAWDGLQKPSEFLNLETSPDRYHLGKKIQREFRDSLLNDYILWTLCYFATNLHFQKADIAGHENKKVQICEPGDLKGFLG